MSAFQNLRIVSTIPGPTKDGVAPGNEPKADVDETRGKWVFLPPDVSSPVTQNLQVIPTPLSKKEEKKIQLMSNPRARMTGRLGKAAPIATSIWYDAAASGTAAAALVNSTSLRPDQCNDWASFISLYDEVKVEKFTAHCRVFSTVQATTGADPLWAMNYDPTDGTNPASIVDVCSSSQHYGPVVVCGTGLATTNNQRDAFECLSTRTGFHTFKFVVPRGTVRSTTTAGLFGREWSATVDTADNYGFIKTYAEAMGTGGVVAFRHLIQFHVHFRSRH